MEFKNGDSIIMSNEFLYLNMVSSRQIQPWINSGYRVLYSEFYPNLNKGNFILVRN